MGASAPSSLGYWEGDSRSDDEVPMRIAVCLLLSLAAGCATYTLGAIVWSGWDPQGAGSGLLFTIPAGFALTAASGLLGLVGLVFRCDWARERTPRATAATSPAPATPLTPRKAATPASTVSQPRPPRQREHAFDYDAADLALAT
jgi:hypothetical protein